MSWNWELPSWPNFTYDSTSLKNFEVQFLQSSGMVIGAFEHLHDQDKSELIIHLTSDEALKTSEIEGEYLNRESLQSSIRRQFGLKADERKVSLAEEGVAQLMVDLYQSFHKPLTHKNLFLWHSMLMKGRSDLQDIGSYRTGSMHVVSGSLSKPKVYFQAPPASGVRKEMSQFIDWFNKAHREKINPLVWAGLTHLYFVNIHPFEDGNGRIARALSQKALSQYVQQPMLLAFSHKIEKKRKDYYKALQRVNRTNEVTSWLVYFAKTVLEAQEYTKKYVKFLIEKTKLYDRLEGQVNDRQMKVIDGMFKQGPDGFKGGLSAKNYIAVTKTSASTATRDLQDLVLKNVLKKTGELKYARYWLNMNI